MTQNLYSGSQADEMRDSSDKQSSSEIRAEIDSTRASVGEKIDQLQARLDPNRLKAQAQETMQEMISDTANSMTEYVRGHRDEMFSSLADAARRNPIPTALVGLGVGWLLLESFAGGKRDDEDYYQYQRRNFRPRQGSRFEGSTGRSFVSQGRGQFMEEEYYSPQYYDQQDYGRSGFVENPGSQSERGYQNASEYQGRTESQGSQEYGNGHHRGSNPLAKAANAVKDTVSDVTDEIKDRVEDAGQGIKDRMGEMRHDVQERVEDVRQGMQERAGDMRHGMQERMGSMQDRMGGIRHQAGEQMDDWQRRARFEGRRRGQQVMRNLEDNPLTYGALALAAGAALALLLPQTRTENRALAKCATRSWTRARRC